MVEAQSGQDQQGLSREQAAAQAGVSVATIKNWQRRGILHPSRPGKHRRITPSDLLAAQWTVHSGDVVPRWRQDPERAGQRLRLLRQAAGLSQHDLALACELSPEGLSYVELGKRPPLGETIRKLSTVLGVAPEQFVSSEPIGLSTLSVAEAASQLGVPRGRIQIWLQTGVLAGRKVSGQWHIPAVAVSELERSGRLRGRSRRLQS